jgi:cytidine deaminase
MREKENRMDYKELMEKAKEAAQTAYAPYSKFKVGACLATPDGKTFCGCNFENSSFGLTICAERNAVGTAIANGERKISAIAIYSPNLENCLPCGACRQVLHEFRSEAGIDVITEAGGELKIYKLDELLPGGFDL